MIYYVLALRMHVCVHVKTMKPCWDLMIYSVLELKMHVYSAANFKFAAEIELVAAN